MTPKKHWLEELVGELIPSDVSVRIGVKHLRELAVELATYRSGLLAIEEIGKHFRLSEPVLDEKLKIIANKALELANK